MLIPQLQLQEIVRRLGKLQQRGKSMEAFAGIDIGTVYSKGVVLDGDGTILARMIEPTGTALHRQAEQILMACLQKADAGIECLSRVGLTGFGRRIVKTIGSVPAVSYPEVLCLCKGVDWVNRNERTGNTTGKENMHTLKPFLILDIGGEKWKYIYSENGKPKDFLLNDMCAAGTGKFIDYVVKSLNTTIEDITNKALKSKKICQINQLCGIFVEAELISKLSSGEHVEDLFAGMFMHMFKSIQSKTTSLNRRSETLYLTGGVSQNVFMRQLFSKIYKTLIVPRDAQFMGALGASLFLLPGHGQNKENKKEE